MAHQTFYIDIDEEITSIVDRLRKAKAREVVIVVPKRALLIQSIVNLKLLKKEAENLKKELIIVTQDKLGKLLVEKTGIEVQQKLDEVDGEEMDLAEISAGRNDLPPEVLLAGDDQRNGVQHRIENMGSTEYFEDVPKKMRAKPAKNIEKEESHPDFLPEAEEKIVNKELITGIGEEIKSHGRRKRSGSLDIVKNIDIRQSGGPKFLPQEDAGYPTSDNLEERGAKLAKKKVSRGKAKEKISFEAENFGSDEDAGDKLEHFFQESAPKARAMKKSDDYGRMDLSGRFWKYFSLFALVAAAVVALASTYLFLPKADIKIFTRTKSQSVDAQIKGDAKQTAIDQEKQAIPARIITVDDQLTENYPVSGSKSSSGQRARGTITIYNEYSSSPQPLVATTRFESPDGKIFRLSKAVTVPGTVTVGGEKKPGAIEAEVVADASGETYNIGPTTFTVPGFKDSGSEKYSKFYAKSFKAMAGGGASGTEVKSIAASDITSAKSKVLADLTQAIKQKLKDSAGSGAVVLDDAVNVTDATYSVSNSEGDAVDKFDVTVKAKASAIVFSESDLKSVIEKDIARAASGSDQIDISTLNLQYGKADADLADGTITIRVNASGKIKPNIDLENLKKGILGKSEDDFKAYLKAYPTIERAEINYWPSFINGKIPAYESRVNMTLDNN